MFACLFRKLFSFPKTNKVNLILFKTSDLKIWEIIIKLNMVIAMDTAWPPAKRQILAMAYPA